MNSAKSLKIFLLHAAILMIGYTVIRYSLTLFLEQDGESTASSYALATSALALQVICCYFWSLILKYIKSPSYIDLVRYGGALLSAGIMVIALLHQFEIAIYAGIAIFVSGTSLYTVNLKALTNAHTDNPEVRRKYNQYLFLCWNAGAMFGLFVGSWLLEALAQWHPEMSYPLLYLGACGVILAALKFFEANRQSLYEIEPSESVVLKSRIWFYIILAIFNVAVLLFILHAQAIRILIIASFVITFLYLFIFSKAIRGKRFNLLFSITGNMVYKITLVTVYVGMSLSLKQLSANDTFLGETVSPIFYYLFDPIANLITGLVFALILMRYKPQTRDIMNIGVAAFAICTAILWGSSVHTITVNADTLGYAALYIFNNVLHAPLTAVLVISFFGIGEYLLAPSIVTEICNMSPNKKSIRSYLGLLELSSAAGLVLGYYIISLTTKETILPKPISYDDLYYVQFLLMIGIFATMCAFAYIRPNKLKRKVHGHV